MTTSINNAKWISRDGLLLSLSAFFADLGYQGVSALYPLYLVLVLKQSPFTYGLITGLSFGIGSLFASFGGRLGDRFPKKLVIIAGNLGILLLAFSGLSRIIWISGLLFMTGWWFRYLRTPSRRALLVQVTQPQYRAKVFGFLHALDIGGGLLSIIIAVVLLLCHISVGHIIAFSAIPILISTLVILPVGSSELYPVETKAAAEPVNEEQAARQSHRRQTIFRAILTASALYGFSFYNLGFPVLSAAKRSGVMVDGLAAYGLYLAVSAISGWLLGSANMSGLRPLWKWGFIPSALASLSIAIDIYLHVGIWLFYAGIAVLGMGMGAVETYEPAMAATLGNTGTISSGMGSLSVARSLGQFGSNFIMGALFVLNQSYAYLFAAAAVGVAAIVLATTDARTAEKKTE